MGDEGVGGFIKKIALCISVRQTNYSRATTLPRYGTGPSLKSVCFSAGSLILYKGSWCPESGAWHPRIRVDAYWGSIHYNSISRAAERHLGSPAVAPELRSEGGTAGACRGGRLHRVGTHAKVDWWRALIDYPNPAYLCITARGGNPTDLSNGVGKVYNLCRV
jgi:hypothetical protein